jgi:hypothetical protein
MKKLTDIAVRLRVISTSLLAIFGFVSLGLVIGFAVGYRISPATTKLKNEPLSSADREQKWCDSTHEVPYIPADQCAGGSSCDRAFLLTGNDRPKDWASFCANIDKQ